MSPYVSIVYLLCKLFSVCICVYVCILIFLRLIFLLQYIFLGFLLLRLAFTSLWKKAIYWCTSIIL